MANMDEETGFSAKKILLALGVLILLVGVAVPGFYFYRRYQSLTKTQPQTQDEVAALIAQVGQLIELPPETPTVATITDVEKLKNQPFFAQAENGDKVLVYTLARKAILYRPSTNKVIEVAPLSIGATPSAQLSPPPTPAPTPTP